MLGLRCALIATSIRSLSGNLPPELLAGMVTVGTPEGKWSAAAALEHIRQMPDAANQARSIDALLKAGCELPWEQALAAARASAVEQHRADALAALAPQLATVLQQRQLWQATLRELAQRGRPALLSDLRALNPWLAALTPAERTAIAQAIVEVARCWP